MTGLEDRGNLHGSRGKIIMPRTILISAIIGAGKSHFATELGNILGPNTLTLLEPDETNTINPNPYLSDFYGDMKRWAFTMQTHLLGQRYAMQQLAQWWVLSNRGDVISDSSYFQDTCYAKLQRSSGHMTEREYESYCQLFKCMTSSVTFPDVCIYLDVEPQTSQERIRRRMEYRTGRKCENVVDKEYLMKLKANIIEMLGVLHDSGVEIVWQPWNEDRPDPNDRKEQIQNIANLIEHIPVKGTSNLFQSYARLL